MSSEIDRKVRFKAMLWILSNLMSPFIFVILQKLLDMVFGVFQSLGLLLEVFGVFQSLGLLLDLVFTVFLLLGFSLVYSLAIWLINRRRHNFINQCTRETLKFTLSTSLYLAVLTSIWISLLPQALRFAQDPRPDEPEIYLTDTYLSDIFVVTSCAISIVCLTYVCLTIFASIQAARGNIYKYPLTIRFFR